MQLSYRSICLQHILLFLFVSSFFKEISHGSFQKKVHDHKQKVTKLWNILKDERTFLYDDNTHSDIPNRVIVFKKKKLK